MRMTAKRDVMAWMFDYRIDWDAAVAAGASQSGGHAIA